MSMPNFLIIGAEKSGTTSLYHYLRQHPDIFMCRSKELYFFAYEGERPDHRGPGDLTFDRNIVTRLEDYLAHFDSVANEKAIGEACPQYLYVPKAAERIRHHLPDARLVVVLRNPADRAYSIYMHLVRMGRETAANFAEALEREDARLRARWGPARGYRTNGFYSEQIARYDRLFGRSRLRIYLFEDLRDDPVFLVQDICRFLGVDDRFVPDVSLRFNVTGITRSRALRNFIRGPNLVKDLYRRLLPQGVRQRVTTTVETFNVRKVPFPPDVRADLVAGYREDIRKLEVRLGRDLSHWFA